jgi:hypothetical protein
VDIPPRLRQLRTFPSARDYQSQPYFSLWSALCHQGDVYTASYAAVPYLVDAVLASPSPGHTRLAEVILELEPSLLDDFMAWVAER